MYCAIDAEANKKVCLKPQGLANIGCWPFLSVYEIDVIGKMQMTLIGSQQTAILRENLQYINTANYSVECPTQNTCTTLVE